MNERAKLDLWTLQVRLEGYEVVSERRDTLSDPVRLTLAPTSKVALCPHCGRPTDDVHRRLDSDPIRDLPHGPQAVELVLRSCQFRCEHCARFFTPACPHVAPGAHATERFLEQAARLIRFSDIASVADFLGVPERTLERWYYDHAQRQLDKAPSPGAALKPIKSLGIDELSLKKSTGSS
jgi:transposase